MTPAHRPPDLTEDDLAPLVQASASRSLDTSLRGARGLALLGDPRALGLLLQLSREEDAGARAEVCRALAALEDPRAADRLRSLLFDPELAVRDAAFTALARVQSSQPLQSAEAGLNASFEDVRRRGLEALLGVLREVPKQAQEPGRALELLGQALNDSFAGVRNEAFKAALNLQVAGGLVRTLRFILQSIHADVRREVLTETMAQIQEPWAWQLLLEFFNDPEARLREEAFTFALRRSKELPPLEAALLSQYTDLRRRAVEALIKKHTTAAQALLVKALADADRDVRQLALEALVGEQAQESLSRALESPHADVRVRAARALARQGEAKALAPLLSLATAPEPAEAERRADWLALVESALEGLAELGEPRALVSLLPLLQSSQASVRRLAARALAWAALPHQLETLRQALQHADPQVKYHAALGLAYAGDPLVASLVFAAPAGEVLSKEDQLTAALTLGPAGEDQLAVFLDGPDEELRTRALLLLLLLELAAPLTLPSPPGGGEGRVRGAPTRCLTCLSARPPRVRLTAARALERFADPSAFRDFVVQLINDRGDRSPWKISSQTVEDLAALLAHGSPAVRARTAQLLRFLTAEEQAAWDQAWANHARRFAGEMQKPGFSKKPGFSSPPEQLQELAFGAYLGLAREQGGRAAEPQVIRVRQTALARLGELAVTPARQASVRLVLVQALSDPNQGVRLQAFDRLTALGTDPDVLGAAALGAGHTDVGVRGLEALAGGGHSAQGQAVLEEALRTRTDELAIEAARLLGNRRGLVPVAGLALGAVSEQLRQQAVAWLAAEYERDATARDLLRQALQSRHRRVVETAALELAQKKDVAAFDTLVTLLKTTRDAAPQRRLIEALQTLGDPRAAAAFLDRLEQDTEGSAPADVLLSAAGNCRRTEIVDRLLALSEKWEGALKQAFVVSGHDQPIEDAEDDKPDRRWLEKQFPRHDAVLARVLSHAVQKKALRQVKQFLPAARWALGSRSESGPGCAGGPCRHGDSPEGGRGPGLAAPQTPGTRRAPGQGPEACGFGHPVPGRRGPGPSRSGGRTERPAGRGRFTADPAIAATGGGRPGRAGRSASPRPAFEDRQ